MWIGPVLLTLFIAYISVLARRWWPVAYACAVLWGFCAGVLTYSTNGAFSSAWWLCWCAYIGALPVWKLRRRRQVA